MGIRETSTGDGTWPAPKDLVGPQRKMDKHSRQGKDIEPEVLKIMQLVSLL